MRYALIVPAAYLLLIVMFFAFIILGAGHGPNPFFWVAYLPLPTGYLLNAIFPSSLVPKNGLISLLILFFAGLVQWALVGFLFDKALARARKGLAGNSRSN